MLKILSRQLDLSTVQTLVLPVIKDLDLYENQQLNDIVKSTVEWADFPSEKKEQLVLHQVAGIKTVILIGLGKVDKITPDLLRGIAGAAVKQSIKLKLTEVHLAVPAQLLLSYETVFEAFCEGASLRNYIFDRYKKEKKDKVVDTVNLCTHWEILEPLQQIAERVEWISTGSCMARTWVTTPANDLTPAIFAEEVRQAMVDEPVSVEIMDEARLRELGFFSMLAVAVGSINTPKFVVLDYNPGQSAQTVALVGKAVTFDSGGLNLKPGESMTDMKSDMSGGAAVAATVLTAARLKLPVRLIGAIPMVENMPSGAAIRPGDIVKSYSGKTIEILNTDAEGRLILVDALCYIKDKYQPDVMIDLATLTGACVVALGEKIAGLFTPEEELASQLLASADRTFERCWRMPLPDDYRETLKSTFADIKNISQKRWGGAISGALFLSEFIEMQRWAHLDIAGPAHITKEDTYCPAGGTGFGVRLLIDYLSHR